MVIFTSWLGMGLFHRGLSFFSGGYRPLPYPLQGVVVIVLGVSIAVFVVVVLIGWVAYEFLAGILEVIAYILILPITIAAIVVAVAFLIAFACICAPFWLIFLLFSLCKLISEKLFGVPQGS